MPTYTQADRFIAVDTPLGKDVLLLRSFSGHEGISQLFSFELDFLSEDSSIPFEKIIGQRISVRVRLEDVKERYFNGFVSRFVQTGTEKELSHYRATMVPWLWFLTRTADCRIFQDMTVPDIILKIFNDLGLKDVKNDLQGSWDPLDYCVQYRETDFNFVSRLMEQYGICYFFEHEAKKHTLILANNSSSHKPCPERAVARWDPEGSAPGEEDVVLSLQIEREFRTGKYALTDYNFETPSTSLMANVNTTQAAGGNDTFEFYDYPGEYEKKAQGEKIAKIRIEEEEAQYVVGRGTSLCRAFTSGYRFDLKDYFRADMNQSYVLTQIQHAASIGDAYRSAGGGSAHTAYSNTFTAIPYKIPYRPARLTPKPIVQGPQTAVVVGPSGEEIYVDKYARVKVQFFWDREGKKNESSSCWIRVSQVHAGKGFGGIDTPRIGEEVIVGFMEGDPDLPIIIGRVYNGQNTPPNGLPGAGMTSGLKSNSTPGGGGNNSIMLNDTKGNELYSMNAQYNCTEHVGNDRTTTIDHDEKLSVGNNRTKKVKVDQSEDVGSNKKIHVGATHTETIDGAKTMTIGGNHTESISGNETITVKTASAHTIALARALTIGAAYQVSVGAAMNETIGAAKAEEIGGAKMVNVGGISMENVGANKSTNAGGNISEKAGGNISETAGGNVSETAGGNISESASGDVSSSAGGKMALSSGSDFSVGGKAKGVIEIADELTIKCGSASIVLKSGGDILIKGNKIDIKGDGDITLKGPNIHQN